MGRSERNEKPFSLWNMFDFFGAKSAFMVQAKNASATLRKTEEITSELNLQWLFRPGDKEVLKARYKNVIDSAHESYLAQKSTLEAALVVSEKAKDIEADSEKRATNISFDSHLVELSRGVEKLELLFGRLPEEYRPDEFKERS